MFLMLEVDTLWTYFECVHHGAVEHICFTHEINGCVIYYSSFNVLLMSEVDTLWTYLEFAHYGAA